MSNRRRKAEPASVREPLLHCLQVEYERAAKAKNLQRMEEITELVNRINQLWAEPVPAPVAQPVEWATPPTLPEPVFVAPEPELAVEWTPPPEPPPPAPQELPPVGGYQMRDLLNSVPEGLWGDAEHREQARGRIKDAVLRVTHEVMAMQMRYELALQAHNRNNRALELFEPEAIALGVSVADLAQRIIAERRAAERRMQHVYTIMAHVSGQIDQATGADIDALVEAGIRQIQAVED